MEAFSYAFAEVLKQRFADLELVPNAVDKLMKFVEGYATVESPHTGRMSYPQYRDRE